MVGVSKDIKQRTLTERPQASAAIPILQFYASSAVLMVRAKGGLESVSAELQRAVREIDARCAVLQREPPRRAHESRDLPAEARRRSADRVWRAGAALAGIGSYGVLSFLVGLRRREIGIRLAVGATRADVFRLVAASGARLVMVGLVIGLLLSIGVGMGLQSLLIGISPADP